MSAQPEAILEWLQKEMGYRSSSSTKSPQLTPSIESLRKVCRGNMIPVFNFLIKRVKSEKTVDGIRRNIMVHGGNSSGDLGREGGGRSSSGGSRGKKEKEGGKEDREMAEREREVAQKEAERMRRAVRRMRKDVRARMLEVAREEAERKRMMDERGNYRYGIEVVCARASSYFEIRCQGEVGRKNVDFRWS